MLNKNKTWWIFPLLIISVIVLITTLIVNEYHKGKVEKALEEAQTEESNFGGRSGPLRDVVGTYGTPTSSTTNALQLNADNDLSSIATSSNVVGLLQQTDSALVTIEQPEASTTNSFYWHITGSNDWECANAIGTSTDDDSYNPLFPLITDINWYNLIAADVSASGMNNSGLEDVTANATGTSFILTDVNWDCLRTEYSGASTTVLMQFKEKILTIQ